MLENFMVVDECWRDYNTNYEDYEEYLAECEDRKYEDDCEEEWEMIKKPAEMIKTENKFRVLIAGHPGIGKTTLGLSAPKPLLIDVDFGINRVINVCNFFS